MKTIATFTKPEEAHLLRIRLQAAGVESFIRDENTIQTGGSLDSIEFGGVRVDVADQDVETVRDLLANDRGTESDLDAPAEAGSIKCLSCQATIAFGHTRCPSCGWSYEDRVKA